MVIALQGFSEVYSYLTSLSLQPLGMVLANQEVREYSHYGRVARCRCDERFNDLGQKLFRQVVEAGLCIHIPRIYLFLFYFLREAVRLVRATVEPGSYLRQRIRAITCFPDVYFPEAQSRPARRHDKRI